MIPATLPWYTAKGKFRCETVVTSLAENSLQDVRISLSTTMWP